MDADRRREVVRWLRAIQEDELGLGGAGDEHRGELARAAAGALEEMGEAPRQAAEVIIRTEVDNARCYLAQGTPGAVEGPLSRILVALDSLAPKPSAASMEERIRALEGEMEHIRNSVRGARIGLAQNGPGWLREWFDGIERRADRALHPHASWCRDLSHDGACIPEETEVERDD